MTTLSAVATVTSRVRLGTLVLGAPFRPPALLAKEAVSVDLLSGGRLDLGIGAGWYEEEFEASGYRFGTVGERFRTLETVLEEIQPLFRTSAPAPAQAGGPPILLGGKGGPRLLRLAARLAAGWNTGWAWTPDAYAGRVAEARRSCEEIGRDPSTFRLSLGLYTIVGEDEKDARARFDRMRGWPHGAAMLEGKTMQAYSADTLTGTCEQVLDRLASFAELGVDEVIVAPAPLPFALPQPEMLEILGARVMPALRSL
jgi:alkanesulfonate monooxygenase SsuD/methylene tetrahydromethanopterin reductase-like flavin-dependent oxidoreductase (luciferase family)